VGAVDRYISNRTIIRVESPSPQRKHFSQQHQRSHTNQQQQQVGAVDAGALGVRAKAKVGLGLRLRLGLGWGYYTGHMELSVKTHGVKGDMEVPLLTNHPVEHPLQMLHAGRAVNLDSTQSHPSIRTHQRSVVIQVIQVPRHHMDRRWNQTS